MPNIQQPEMRRSGQDPLVQDSTENRAGGPTTARGRSGRVPTDQRSPYGPRPPRDRVPQATTDEDETEH
jgi:hypothetical protein